MSQIVLVATTEQFADRVATAMASRPNVLITRHTDPVDPAHLDEVVQKISAQAPHVVVVGPLLQIGHQMRIAELIDRNHHDTSAVMVAELSAEQWQFALRAGARDVLSPDADEDTIRRSLDHAANVAIERRIALQSAMTQSAAPKAAGRVITVVSPKGGSGKTVTSTNLAVAMAQRAPGRVALVDFDLQFGDVAIALHLEPEFTIMNAVSGPMDPAALRAQFVRHSSGLMVLCAPDRPEDAEDIAPDAARELLASVAQQFDFVIVDTGAGLDDVTIAAIESASDLVFVTSTDVPSVRGIYKVVDILDRLQVAAPRRHLVLNRSDARVGLVMHDIEATTGMSAAMTLPSSRVVPIAMNQGTSLVESSARSPITRSFHSFAASLLGEGAAQVTTARNRRSFR
jgi:pilus assembly protein CpaE